jgi:hypothetical protein
MTNWWSNINNENDLKIWILFLDLVRKYFGNKIRILFLKDLIGKIITPSGGYF